VSREGAFRQINALTAEARYYLNCPVIRLTAQVTAGRESLWLLCFAI